MAGQCVLMGFSKGTIEPTTDYTEWAMAHLCYHGTPGAKGSITDSEWTKKYFTTIKETIPDPPGQSLTELEIWAKENFITVD